MKVGQDLENNLRARGSCARRSGPERVLMMDANQCWDVGESIRQMKALARFDPWWIEEPTSPDDVARATRPSRARWRPSGWPPARPARTA